MGTGKALPWEKPITPAQMYDLQYSMTVFATEGCASCHRLRGLNPILDMLLKRIKKTKLILILCIVNENGSLKSSQKTF